MTGNRHSSSAEVLASVVITEVFRGLGGDLRHRRGRAFWRDGGGLNVSLDDNRGVWHDFVTNEGGGVLDLVVRARGGTRRDALHWVAEFAGVPLEDKALSSAERAEWAKERRELEQNLPDARYWQRSAVNMADDLLNGLKAALFDPTQEQPETGEIYRLENMLARLRRLDGAALVAEFQWWRGRYPGMTAGMIRAAKSREQAERRALLAYLRIPPGRRAA